MKATDFVVSEHPRLAAIKHFPVVEFADYERRIAGMQQILQQVHDPNAIDRLHFTAAVAFRWAALVKRRRRRDRPSA
jgi:hypothetical protein